MIEIWDGQSDLRSLAESWAEEIGVKADIDCAMEDLTVMLNSPKSDVIILKVSGIVVGGIGITIQNISHTRELHSAVRYWYIFPEHRSLAFKLINAAKSWSKGKGCVKMMIGESKYMPCGDFYKAMGFEEHEIVYIGDL